uniref:Uncharacterized protein n=1 Tax=Arundo donax TaxID=35708 RepID=A0A0A9GGE4_ARUDO
MSRTSVSAQLSRGTRRRVNSTSDFSDSPAAPGSAAKDDSPGVAFSDAVRAQSSRGSASRPAPAR